MTFHADAATLVAYWLGELDEARESALEEHYLGCEECSTRLGEIEALAAGVKRAFANGRVLAVLSPTFAERLQSAGVRVREYRVPRNGSVNCTVTPEDQMLLSRLQAPLEGVGRVDLVVGDLRLEDVPFDAARGEVVMTPGTENVRARPAHREVARLVAVEAGGDRVLGEYTFNHKPHVPPSSRGR